MPYSLTNEADEDYVAIYRYGVEQFGIEQAERYADRLDEVFAFLAEHPRAARLRDELNPPVRAHPCAAHIVVYTVEPSDDVLILRIRHNREDWAAD